MNLHHLWVFYHVARAGNFTRAAAALGVSQPAVSEQVRALEADLGVPLVEVAGRTTRLTPEGQELAAYARRIFALVREAEEAMAAARALERGTLRVAASTTPGTYLLPAVLQVFRQRHPGVGLQVGIGNSAWAAAQVAEGEADLAITGGPPAGHPDLQVAPLCPDPFAVVAAPHHPLAGQRAIAPTHLVAHPFLYREPGSGTRAVFQQWLADQGLEEPPGLELGNMEAVKNAARAGLGLAALPLLAVQRDLALGDLVALDVAGPPMGRTLQLVRRRRPLPPAAAAFLAVLEAHVAGASPGAGPPVP